MKRIAVYLTDEEFDEVKKRAGLVALSRWIKETVLNEHEGAPPEQRGRRVETDSAGF